MTTSDPTPVEPVWQSAWREFQDPYLGPDTEKSPSPFESFVAGYLAALRTEQSARQEWMDRAEAARLDGDEIAAENKVLQQRIDAALAWSDEFEFVADTDLRKALRNAVRPPTESKEPAPKLDPEPIATDYSDVPGELTRVLYYAPMHPFHRFLPRPEFSQNRADYRVEESHE